MRCPTVGASLGGPPVAESRIGDQSDAKARQSLPDALESLDAALSRTITSMAAKIIESWFWNSLWKVAG